MSTVPLATAGTDGYSRRNRVATDTLLDSEERAHRRAAIAAFDSGASSSQYRFAETPAKPMIGTGGLPYAEPVFLGAAEANIRHPNFLCAAWAPGPNVPREWFVGGDGWVTPHFTDVEPYSFSRRLAGVHRCQVPVDPQSRQSAVRSPTQPAAANLNGRQCGYVVTNTERWASNGCCWCPNSPVAEMEAHLVAAHGLTRPMARPWSTALFDTTNTQGYLDAWCCVPCQGSRQLMALSGYADSFSVGLALFLCYLGCQCNKGQSPTYNPPSVLTALLTRYSVVQLNNLDEDCCTSLLISCCCPCCSLAQTYRELSAVGVWPGGECVSAPPAVARSTLVATYGAMA